MAYRVIQTPTSSHDNTAHSEYFERVRPTTPIKMPTTNYQNVHFYIIDSPTSDGHGPLKAPPARVRESDHRFFCRLLEDDIKELFGIKVERLYCPANTSDSSFSDRVDNLLKDKKVGDLLVFYYHGRAAGKKEDYIW